MRADLLGLLATLIGCTNGLGAVLELADDNNFDCTIDVDIFESPAAASTDVVFDWSGLTLDMLDQDFSPIEESSSALLVVFQGMTEEEIEDGIANDALSQSSVGLYVTCEPTDARCALSDLALSGTDADVEQYFEADSGIWMVGVLSLQSDGSVQHRKLQFLTPTPQAPTLIEMADGQGSFDVDADLESMEGIAVSEPFPVLDWSGLTRNGVGNPLSLHKIDQLIISAYQEDLQNLSGDFIAIESYAEETWTVDVAGHTGVDLAEVEGFGGLDDTHLWMIGLRCSTCLSPLPSFLGAMAWQAE